MATILRRIRQQRKNRYPTYWGVERRGAFVIRWKHGLAITCAARRGAQHTIAVLLGYRCLSSLISGVPWLILDCARPTRAFLGRALREHGRPTDCLPPLLTSLSSGSYNHSNFLCNWLIQLIKWQNLRTSMSRDERGWSMSAPKSRPNGRRPPRQ